MVWYTFKLAQCGYKHHKHYVSALSAFGHCKVPLHSHIGDELGDNDSDSGVGAIVGAVVGCCVLLILVILAIIMFKR